MFDLKDQVAVVTGANGVLISAMAKELAARGAKVALLSRNADKLKQLATDIESAGGTALAIAGDVTSTESLESAAKTVMDTWGKVDLLVHGAGGNSPDATAMPGKKTFFELPTDALRFVTELNLLGTMLPCQIFGKLMADRQRGNIINISSLSAFKPLTRVVGYGAAKAAINNFTEWLSVYMAKEISPNIRVNAIAPGFFLTEQNRFLLTNEDGSLTDRGQTIINQTPQGRFGEPSDLLSTLVWLASPGAGFITGIVVPVDGGFQAFSGV
ncbi:MAG: SDR family oxidoreductase [Kiritimatiellae bacterium]|jgi:NAD(P)-dependent dehydrogenase (short-subunit alcohol dehydrogenase family)|nr:SDR family oxidoreductase [Kiritimatiellia bacterium]